MEPLPQIKLDGTIVFKTISEIKPNPNNRNKHTHDQIDRLCELIKYQGFRQPLVISNNTGLLVVGHGRLLAAQQLGMTAVPVVFEDFDSPEQEYAFGVSDNAIAIWAELDLASINSDIGDLGPDFDLDLLGIKDFVLDPSEKLQPGCDEDEIPEKVEPKTCLGDIYQLGNHRLMCGDSTAIDQVEAVMNGEKASFMFTSPPYADLRDYGGNLDMDTKTLSKVFDWPTDIIVINLGLIIRDREIVTYWDDYLSEAKIRGLKLLAWNIWNKGNASAPAHQQAMFGLCHEWIFVFGKYRQLNLTKPNKLFGEDSWSASTVREKDGSMSDKTSQKVRSHRQLDTVIDMVPVKNNLTGHPATFPVDLPFEYINAVTSEDEIVCEPFGGSGSTLIACEKTNRRCFMMEIDPHYCDVIVARWEKYTGKKAEILNA